MNGAQLLEIVRVLVGVAALVLVAGFGILVLRAIMKGTIKLDLLLGDKDGDASTSRFQLLIFTFVIGLSFIYLIILPGSDRFPEITGGVLTLLGISGTSYLAGKSLDNNPDNKSDNKSEKKPGN